MARDIPGDLDHIARVMTRIDELAAEVLTLEPAMQVYVLDRWNGAVRAARRRSRRRTTTPTPSRLVPTIRDLGLGLADGLDIPPEDLS